MGAYTPRSPLFRAAFLPVVAAAVLASFPRPLWGFSVFVHSLLDNQRRPSIAVNASVPYANLVFLKKSDNLYEAEYRLYVRILDPRGKEILKSTVVSQKVAAESYAETRSKKKSSGLAERIPLAPGDYLVRCTIQVKNTHLAYSKDTIVNVPNFLEAGIGLSEPRLFATEIDTLPFSPVLSRSGDAEVVSVEELESTDFAEVASQPAFGFQVYLDKPVRDSLPCELVYEVVDRDKSQLLYGKRQVKIFGENDGFVIRCNVDDWDSGSYTFNVKVTVRSPNRTTESKLPFKLVFSRAMLTRGFDTTVQILSLIATDEEVEQLKSAKPDERTRVWSEFWKRRDPTSRTERNEALEEHLRRVQFASDNFSTSEPGWRSDRGKIYIKYGEPDEIEVKTDPYYQGEYLIWRYFNRNLTFVFYDRFGLGDYQLTNTRLF